MPTSEVIVKWDKIGTDDGLGKYIPSENCFEIFTPHALTQLIGYIKFLYRRNGPVFFRGQNKIYNSMKPSLLRDVTNVNSIHGRQGDITHYINTLIENNVFMKSTEIAAYEPLLQHYGIKTIWLDIVDNIWTALWFASHTSHTTGVSGKYIHYEPSRETYSYIFIMHFGKVSKHIASSQKNRIIKVNRIENNKTRPIIYPNHGFFDTNTYRIIDLRCMTPSLYRRPHSQHAWLARKIRFLNNEDIDYSDAIVGIIKIKTNLIVEWLGNGILSKAHFMFPPPTYDPGYKLFLDKGIDPHKIQLGSIQHVGA